MKMTTLMMAAVAAVMGGWTFRAEAGASPAWRITLQKGNEHVSVRSEPQTIRRKATGPQTERFICETLKDAARTYPVTIEFDVVTTADACSVKGRVVNRSDWRVTGFEGPRFDGIPVEPATMGLYVPDGFGRRVSNFPKAGEKKPVRLWGRDPDGLYSFFTGYYPGRGFVMPWIALDDGKTGVYVGVHDAAARNKRFRFRYDPVKGCGGIASCHPLFLEPGQTWTMPETR